MRPRLAIVLAAALSAACSSAEPTKAEPAANEEPPAKADPPPTPPGANADAPAATARTWTFDDDTAPTAGVTFTETAGQGTPAVWKVVARDDAPSPPNVLAIAETRNDKRTYNVALLDDTSYVDVDITVMVHAVTGALDQGGGPIWRVRDESNYYIARWNPLEKNLAFYVVLEGVRTTLLKAEADLDPAQWHELRIVHQGTRMQCFVDDEPMMNIEDASLRDAGKVGLWTKADAATLFDDLSVTVP
jgi:hypothetical protein